MASMGSPKTWIPYVNNKDCSAGFCSVYCPQWCYILFPPPPPPNSSQFPQDDDSSPNFSPLIIAIIGILASAFLLVSYYTIISKYCGNRNSSSSAARREENHHDPNAESDENHNHPSLHEPWHIATPGLDEALIRSITVCKYKRGDGLIDGTDCSVCLSEFHDGESVRLLPKCSHAFHVPCIDMWLRSHSNCPMCRAHIIFIGANSLPQPPPLVTAESPQGINESVQDSVANDQNVATAAAADNQEDAGRVAGEEQGILQPDEPPKTPFRVFSDLGSLDERNSVIDMIIRCEGNQPIWRSISMDHSPQTRVGRARLAEILQTEQDEEVVVARMEEGWSGEASVEGTMSGQQRRKGVHCVLSPVAMKRSFSSGRFFLTRPGRVRDMSISPVRKN